MRDIEKILKDAKEKRFYVVSIQLENYSKHEARFKTLDEALALVKQLKDSTTVLTLVYEVDETCFNRGTGFVDGWFTIPYNSFDQWRELQENRFVPRFSNTDY